MEVPSEAGGMGAAAVNDDVIVGGANMGRDVTKVEDEDEAVD